MLADTSKQASCKKKKKERNVYRREMDMRCEGNGDAMEALFVVLIQAGVFTF
jgi:hypothetical protein